MRVIKPKSIFISFIEEFWPKQIKGTTIGRIEVIYNDIYHSEEIRWGCWKNREFDDFREKYDFREVSEKELKEIKRIVARKFAPELFEKEKLNE